MRNQKNRPSASSDVVGLVNRFQFVECIDLHDILIPAFPDLHPVMLLPVNQGNLFPVSPVWQLRFWSA